MALAVTGGLSKSSNSLPSSLIAFYAHNASNNPNEIADLGNAVHSAWEEILNSAPPENFVDSLTTRKIIQFRETFTGSKALRLFFDYIYPLLLEMAKVPDERVILNILAKHCLTKNHFLVIIPKLEKTIQGSCVNRAIQGISLAKFKREGLSYIELVANSDSFIVEIAINDPVVEILEDNRRSWHLGSVPNRSRLVHELGHILQWYSKYSYGLGDLYRTQSWRWTDEAEKQVINLENDLLHKRKDMSRISHNSFSVPNEAQTPTEVLYYGLQYGADGTVKQICDRHSAASEDSPDRFKYTPQEIAEYAKGYLMDIPRNEQMISQEDVEYRILSQAHKDRAINHLIAVLQIQDAADGKRTSEQLVHAVYKQASPTRIKKPFPKSLSALKG